tara:strand:- start:6340 stop:6531 length:192 start_codon:yes stop_codon:yes gene_type:complete
VKVSDAGDAAPGLVWIETAAVLPAAMPPDPQLHLASPFRWLSHHLPHEFRVAALYAQMLCSML